MQKKSLLIIGGGLSGLLTAYLLQDDYDVTLLEARERLGGRIFSHDGHDLGPSWVWPHQKQILHLLDALGLEPFEQYTRGKALYDIPAGVQEFDPPPGPASYRVDGGISSLVNVLSSRLTNCKVFLEHAVHAIKDIHPLIEVHTAEKVFHADYVISTLPPRLAAETINYTPVLDSATHAELLSQPTWMGYSTKCVIEFSDAFWREKGLSGFCFSHVGPLGEIHDACTADKAALFGFLHHRASIEGIETQVRTQMQRLFGEDANKITNILCMDWRQEVYSSSSLDYQGLQGHPEYGFSLSHCDNRVLFSGTESSYDNGGYLEGAVISAFEISKKLKSRI